MRNFSVLIGAMLVVCPAFADAPPVAGTAAPADLDKLAISPDLTNQLAKYRRVKMPFNAKGLTPRELQLVNKLVDACRYLEIIYWLQSDTEGYALLQQLKEDASLRAKELRRLLTINGSRYDLIRNNAPFVGTAPRPPGGDLFPADLTREALEKYVLAHPDQKKALYDPFTVVRRKGDALEAIPYHIAFKQWLEPAARLLREAADLSDDQAFVKFLRLRADALLTDDYFQSDLAWLDLVNPKFDIIFAPYETYLDDLLGVKTSYGAAVMIRDDAASHKLDEFKKYVPNIQDALPLAAADRPSMQGKLTPMEVVNAPFRSGDLRHGYQAVADNLPNDPRVHEQHGSKKMFFGNFLDARVNYVILPIAKRLMRDDQAATVTGEGYLATTMMHEISHGLGPAFARTAAGKVDIREAIGGEYSGLEEAKADIVGLYGLKWLVDHNAIPKEKLPGYYASFVAGIFRTVRFGVAEAHGRAEIMHFNYLSEQHAINWDDASKRYVIDFARMPDAVASLAQELLEQEATGDRKRVEGWFKTYGAVPPQLAKILQTTSDVPVDIDPVSDFGE
jgi:hypothetical protein